MVKSNIEIISELEVLAIDFLHHLIKIGLKDRHFSFLTLGNFFGKYVINDKLGKGFVTWLSGLWKARTEEVGRPTKPAPKQETFKLFFMREICLNIKLVVGLRRISHYCTIII